MRSFKTWLEHKDIFGFEREIEIPAHQAYDGPAKHINNEYIFKELMKPLGAKEPHSSDFNQIIWGEINLGEAIKIDLSPLGSLKLNFHKIIKDLQGNETWVCKRILPLPDGRYYNEEDTLVADVFTELEKLNSHYPESAKNEYNLEVLALKLAAELKATRPCKIMYFEKVHKVNENNYIIQMGLGGHGVEAPDSRRVECFHIHLFFDRERGLIRCFGNDIDSPTNRHEWSPQPSEWDEHFAPSQSKKEIIQCVIDALSTY